MKVVLDGWQRRQLALCGDCGAGVRLTGIVMLGVTTYFSALWPLGFRLADFAKRAAE